MYATKKLGPFLQEIFETANLLLLSCAELLTFSFLAHCFLSSSLHISQFPTCPRWSQESEESANHHPAEERKRPRAKVRNDDLFRCVACANIFLLCPCPCQVPRCLKDSEYNTLYAYLMSPQEKGKFQSTTCRWNLLTVFFFAPFVAHYASELLCETVGKVASTQSFTWTSTRSAWYPIR